MSMSLRDFLSEKRVAELEAFYGFWIGGSIPDEAAEIRADLESAMTDADTVKARFGLLEPRVLRIVATALNNPGFELTTAEVRADGAEDVDGALNRLMRDGFLHFRASGTRGSGPAFVVPAELGEFASRTLKPKRVGIDAAFSLRKFCMTVSHEELLRRVEPTRPPNIGEDRAAILDGLLTPDWIDARIRQVSDHSEREVVRALIEDFGGVLTRSQFERMGLEGIEWNEDRLRSILEESLLGTCHELSLEEYGISLMEPCAIAFPSVVEAVLLSHSTVEGGFERESTAGIDWLSDLAEIQSEIARGEVRLTQKGELYKATLRRFTTRMVSEPESFITADEHAEALTRTLTDLGLVRVDGDRNMIVTDLAATWENLPQPLRIEKALQSLLVQPEPGDAVFHLEGLRTSLMEVLSRLEVGRWYEPMAVPFVARNRYFARLEADNIKESYQSRFQYAGPPIQSDPARLAWNLFEFLRKRLHPLGIVDLAFRGERVAAVRLTALGAVTLGIEPDEQEGTEGSEKRIVAHADFEVLLFPEGRDDPLIHELDRFATRVKSENVYHYKLDRDSVTRAIAAGATAEEILAVLEHNARNPVPQNVTFSLAEWAERVRFVSVERVFLLSAKAPETIDQVADLASIRPLVLERLTPTTLSLRQRPDKLSIRRELEELGVFFR